MPVLKRFAGICAAVALLMASGPKLAARTKKADKLVAQGRQKELHKDWDGALELYEQALSLDPGDAGYQLSVDRVRFQASMSHVNDGLRVRSQGALEEAMQQFIKAYAIDPSSIVAQQEIQRTREMIEREKRKAKESGGAQRTPEERALTPVEEAKKETEARLSRILPVPELKPLNPQPINLKMNNQPPRVLYETVGKLAGINVLFDPEYQPPPKNQSIELSNATLEEALDYVGVITKSFWKPLSTNTIFISNDNPTKRRDYEEQVMKVFYLTNVNTPQELQEIITAVRAVADIQRLYVYNSQNAIIARGEADRIALAEKIISDLDKPKSEVVVDVMVMEVSSVYSRKLAAALAPQGLNMPVKFTPRNGITIGGSNSNGSGSNGSGNGSGDNGTGTGNNTGNGNSNNGNNGGGNSGGSTTGISLANLGKISSADYSVVLPDGLLQAILTDTGTRVLQSPQLRSVDNVKASLKIGDRQPTATGSFQPGVGGVNINPLVNTQFSFIDVGVNLDVTPRVHENNEVSLHVMVDISKVTSTVNLGGIDQPVIGQRKLEHEIRLRDGEINLLGGLTQVQETKAVTGIPGLSNIPILRRLFTSESLDKNNSELLIALIPHIVRRPSFTAQNLRSIAVGNQAVVKLNYAPRAAETPEAPKPPPAAGQPPAPQPPAPAPAPKLPAPAGQAAVRFVPPQADVAAGSALEINLMADNMTDLAAAPMQIKYDPKVLRLDSVVQGDLLARDGQQVSFAMNIRNDSGDASVTLNRMPGAAGVSGSGVLVTLRFHAISKGTAPVSLSQIALRNSQGQPISAPAPVVTVNVR